MSTNPTPFDWPRLLRFDAANRTYFALAAIATAAAIALGYWRQAPADARVNLWPRVKLLDRDIGEMQLAFGEAGLNDYEIREGQVWVKQAHRDRYLKALVARDALPETSREMYEQDNASPWRTGSQEHEANLLRKKRMIRQLVLQLEFVADAIVDYDEVVEPGWPTTTRRSAAIVVRPRESRLLESYQVDAIRHTICGAVAGLQPNDIVITDIAAGHAYVGAAEPAHAADPAAMLWLEKAKLEQRIRDALTHFGPDVEATVQLETLESLTPETHPAAPKPPPELEAAVANQPAAIAPREPAATDASLNARQPTAMPDRAVVVRIRLPACSAREYLRLGPAAEGGDGGDAALDKALPALQSEIRAAIAPLINVGPWKQKHIEVSVVRPALADRPAGAGMSQARAWSTYVPAVAIVIAATAVALITGRLIRPNQSRSISASDSNSSPDAAGGNAAEAIPDETRRRLKQMVVDDPDQAAEIIKQWIREAA
jgi:hypothetical protein